MFHDPLERFKAIVTESPTGPDRAIHLTESGEKDRHRDGNLVTCGGKGLALCGPRTLGLAAGTGQSS